MCGCALISGQWDLKSVFYFSLFFPITPVFCWNHRTEIYLTGDWLFGALLAEVSQFPLFRGINLDLATCLRPFRTRGSSSGGKSGQASPRSRRLSDSLQRLLFSPLSFCLFLQCVFFKCCLSLPCSLSHTHSAVCLHNIWFLKHWSPCKTKTKLCSEWF